MKLYQFLFFTITFSFISSSYAQDDCDHKLFIVNHTDNKVIKVQEGMFGENEFILPPGKSFEQCYRFGARYLSIKSVDTESMQLVRMRTCPQHLSINGKTNISIKDAVVSNEYYCQMISSQGG